MKKYKAAIFWGYAAEIILASVLYAAVNYGFGSTDSSKFIMDTALAWAAFTGALFAAALTIWIILFQVATTPFGEWLMWRGAMKVYSHGFAYAIIIYAIQTAIFIICTNAHAHWILPRIGLLMLLLGAINLVTMIKTTMGILMLQTEYKRQEHNLK